jgi:hypothetical protein
MSPRNWGEYDLWRQEQLQRLEPNRTAFQKLLPELLKTRLNQFVAIYRGKVVDADLVALAWSNAPALRAGGYDYDASADPPAAYLRVQLTNLDSEASIRLRPSRKRQCSISSIW